MFKEQKLLRFSYNSYYLNERNILMKKLHQKEFKYNFYPEKNNHKTIYSWIKNGHFYENDIGLFLTRIISPKDTCVDIGANIGMHSLLMSSLVGSEGKVIAFEPGKESSEELRANIKLNNFKNIKLKKIILGENSGEEVFFHCSSHDSGTSYGVKKPDNENLDWKSLKTSTLDKEINDKKIKVVKIDVEGFEGQILRGSQSLLKNDIVRYWIVEYAPHCLARLNDSLNTMRVHMRKYGLEMFVLDPSGGLPKYIPHKSDLKLHGIPNLLFTKMDSINVDWLLEDLEQHYYPKMLYAKKNLQSFIN